MNKKKILARELLVLFACAGFVGIHFLIIILNNAYWNHIESVANKNIVEYSAGLDKIPSWDMCIVYRKVENELVRWYVSQNDTFVIEGVYENDFKRDYPDAILISPKNYYFIYSDKRFKEYFTNKMIDNAPYYIDGKEKIFANGEITYCPNGFENDKEGKPQNCFSYIPYEDFYRKLESDVFYCHDFWECYKDSIQYGDFKDFKNQLRKSKGYNDSFRNKRIELVDKLKASYSEIQGAGMCRIEDFKSLLLTLIISTTILFPIRYLFFIIKWAIKQVK